METVLQGSPSSTELGLYRSQVQAKKKKKKVLRLLSGAQEKSQEALIDVATDWHVLCLAFWGSISWSSRRVSPWIKERPIITFLLLDRRIFPGKTRRTWILSMKSTIERRGSLKQCRSLFLWYKRVYHMVPQLIYFQFRWGIVLLIIICCAIAFIIILFRYNLFPCSPQ